MSTSALQLGDKIRGIGAPGFSHVGVVIALPPFGSPLIAHNRKGRGVEFVPLEEFSEGRDVEIVSRVRGGYELQAKMVRRARALQGRAYDFLFFNCEHYASFVQTGEAKSPQVRAAVGFLLAIVIGAALFSEA